MEQLLVNQDYLQKFIVVGIYDNGLMLKAARTKSEKESEAFPTPVGMNRNRSIAARTFRITILASGYSG